MKINILKAGKSLLKLLSGFILVFLFAGCVKEFDKYYKVPDKLIGTILDVLKKDGNYTQFCKAVEMVDYSDVLGKTGNFTVFAPDDKAFEDYFKESGYASLEQVPKEELRSVIMYHIVFWSYSKFKLINGLGVEDATVKYNTDNFRKETLYKPLLTIESDSTGRKYKVYHEYKFIPVYSTEYFANHRIDGSSNYTFFYPNTEFTDFNADRAKIVEADVPAQNGWIHKINKVLIPPDNHEQILKKHADFSHFKSLLDKRLYFEYSDLHTRQQLNSGDINNNGVLDSLFVRRYSLFSSHYPWQSYNSSTASLDIEDIDGNGQANLMTVFAPTNLALSSFFAERIKGYKSLEEISDFWMDWYLHHYFSSGYWPSQLSSMTENWDWDLATTLQNGNISQSEIAYSQMASNGPFYGINKYLLPKVFETVVQPIFGDKNYEWFCELLIFYNVDILLNNTDIEFTVFAPSNQAMTLSGYSARNGLGGFGLYQSQNPLAPVSRSRATDIIKSHIVFGAVDKSNFEEGTFLKTVQNSYIGIGKNGIYGGGDLVLSTVGTAENGGLNGVLYPISRMLISPGTSILQILSDQANHPEFEEFLKLLQTAGMILLDESFNYVALNNLATGINYTCFVPSNNAIDKASADGKIPSDPEELRQFLRYHFAEGVVFADGMKSGIMKTTRYEDNTHTNFSTIEIFNQMNNLNVKDNMGNIRKVTSANIMASNGVVHMIDSVLFYK